MRNKSRKSAEINSSSMADIAFLLLIFFLVTTTIVNDKGISLLLPPKKTDEIVIAEIHDRNLFNIQINSADQLMINKEVATDLNIIRSEIKDFILNNGRDAQSSESPQKAVVSIKTNRGTSYARYIEILNTVQGAYYDIYADRVSLTNETYRALKIGDPEQREVILKAREGIPMNISIAEPGKLE